MFTLLNKQNNLFFFVASDAVDMLTDNMFCEKAELKDRSDFPPVL